MPDDLNDLYQQVILDHSRAPRNFRVMTDASCTAQGHNPICGDNITLYLRADADTIKDVSFQGSGCAICKASSSILTETLRDKSKIEARQIFDNVHNLVTTGKASEPKLGKLAVFAGVHKFPARVKCAILAWHAAMSALEGKSGEVTTENDAT